MYCASFTRSQAFVVVAKAYYPGEVGLGFNKVENKERSICYTGHLLYIHIRRDRKSSNLARGEDTRRAKHPASSSKETNRPVAPKTPRSHRQTEAPTRNRGDGTAPGGSWKTEKFPLVRPAGASAQRANFATTAKMLET